MVPLYTKGQMPRKTKKDRESRQVVGYARVSTVKQSEEGYSLEAQQERIRDYCKLWKLDLVDIVEDAGVSASTPLGKRPGGARVLELLESVEIGNVVGFKLDRFFRNTMDCLSSINSWDDEGIAFHLIDHGGQTLNTSSAGGKLFITFLAGIAEWERNVISERTIMALEKKAKLGEPLGTAPYGSRWNKKTHRIERDTEELETVSRVLDLHVAGLSIRKIAQLLNDNDVPCRGRAWHATTIARIIKRAGGAPE